MSTYPGTIPLFFSIDCDHDISASPLHLSLDGGTSFTLAASYVAAPSPRQLAEPPRVAAGFTRYWWTVLAGVGQQLPLSCGPNVFYGQLVDNPAVEPHAWQRTLPYFPV